MTRKLIRELLIPILVTAVVVTLGCRGEEAPQPDGPKQFAQPPAMAIDPNKHYTATIVMDKGGEIVIELFAETVPNTVNNFVFLARQGFYDQVTFHRVIPGFMAQTGDPTGTGIGGPGYEIENEFSNELRHDEEGVLSMANKGIINGKGTNGSQFFITYVPAPALDGLNPDGSSKDCAADRVSCHSVFGKVIKGKEVATGITPRDPQSATTPGDTIKTIIIDEN